MNRKERTLLVDLKTMYNEKFKDKYGAKNKNTIVYE